MVKQVPFLLEIAAHRQLGCSSRSVRPASIWIHTLCYSQSSHFVLCWEAVDTSKCEFKFEEPDFEGLTKFLVEDRVCPEMWRFQNTSTHQKCGFTNHKFFMYKKVRNPGIHRRVKLGGVHLQQRACGSLHWEAEELEASWIQIIRCSTRHLLFFHILPLVFSRQTATERLVRLRKKPHGVKWLSDDIQQSSSVDSFFVDSVSCCCEMSMNKGCSQHLKCFEGSNLPRSRTKQRPLDMFFGTAKVSRQQSYQTIWRFLLSCWTWSKQHLLRCWLGSCDILRRYCYFFLLLE